MTQAVPGTRIGILGGTLDPIHVGHVEAALAAKRALDLVSVIVMPARVPPHRHNGPSASTFHRFAMAALAVNGLPGLCVSDEELSADGPSYTALTLERLARRGIDRSQIFFITGADAFAEIETWHRYPEVLDLANFVVISRPGLTAGAMTERLPGLRSRFHLADISMPLPQEPAVFLVDAATPNVSSTDIRRRLREGTPVTGMVPPPVEDHIVRHRLYTEPSTADHLR